jgi:hypothetical protein
MPGDVEDQLHMEGGKRRIDRVLSPAFIENLADLSLAEVKRRRDEALAEREYLSLLRRLVQGRFDILRAERAHRTGGEEGPLVDRLPETLADETPAASRGEVIRVAVPDNEIAMARRRIEQLMADVTISDPASLSEEEMARAEQRLGDEERVVSEARAAVIAVHDTLQGELKRRYKDDLSQITAP